MNPGGSMGIPGNENPNPGTAGGTPTLAFDASRSAWPAAPLGPGRPGPSRSGRGRSCCVREDTGPRLPPVSVAILLLMAVGQVSHALLLQGTHLLTFGRYSRPDLNVWLLDYHARLNRPSTAATILGCEHPLTVRLGKPLDRNDADSGLVVAAVAWPEPNAPACLNPCQLLFTSCLPATGNDLL